VIARSISDWRKGTLAVLLLSSLHVGISAQQPTPEPSVDGRVDSRLDPRQDSDVTDVQEHQPSPPVRDTDSRALSTVLMDEHSGSRPTLFDVTWGAQAGYDTHLATAAAVPILASADSGTWKNGEAALGFARRGRRTVVTLGAAGSGRFYSQAASLNAVDANADIGLASSVGRRTALALMHRVRYQPYYQPTFSRIAPFDDALLFPSAGILAVKPALTSEGLFGLSRLLGRVTTVTADYGYRRTQMSGVDDSSYWQVGRATVARKLKRYAGLRLGYGMGTGRDGVHLQTAATVTHDVDAGINYARPLSQSNYISLSFASGATRTSDQRTGGRLFLLLDGDVTRTIRRSWTGAIRYHQGVSFVEGILGPLYGRTVTARVARSLVPRFRLAVTASHGNGDAGAGFVVSGYSTSSAGADAAFDIHRRLSLVTRYDYYRYRFDNTHVLPFGIGDSLNRHSLLIGLSGRLR